MSLNTISSWIRSVISYAYGASTNRNTKYGLWDLGTLSLLKRNCAVQQVLKADRQ